RQAQAMALRDPARDVVQLQGDLIEAARLKRRGMLMAVTMGEIERPIGDERRGAVRRDIAEPRREMGLGAIGRQSEMHLRRAEDLDIRRQGRRIEAEGARVLDPLVEREIRALPAIAAPAAAVAAGDL